MANNAIQLLLTVVQFYSIVVLIRVILTWLPNISRQNPIVEFIHQGIMEIKSLGHLTRM